MEKRQNMRAAYFMVGWLIALYPALNVVAAEDKGELMRKFNIDALAHQNAETELPYLEFLRVESMSAYIYELRAGAEDEQSPHDQDEIYYVVAGNADFTAGDETTTVKPGDILFVRKFAKHHFSNIRTDLRLLVVFAPPDTE